MYLMPLNCTLKIVKMTLDGVAQWIEYQPGNQKVTGSRPSQGHAWVASLVPSRGT